MELVSLPWLSGQASGGGWPLKPSQLRALLGVNTQENFLTKVRISENMNFVDLG